MRWQWSNEINHFLFNHSIFQTSAQKFVRSFLEALNCEDESRVEELLISASEAKLDKEVGNCEHDDQVEQGEGGQPRPSNKKFQGSDRNM